ncbi:MAG: DMT family transporter, partial [Candidatus Lokiarchaeota archaeon]
LFHERITLSILIGGLVILSSVFILSSKDKPKERDSSQLLKKSEDNEKNPNRIEHNTEDLFLGIILGILTAFLWAIAIVSFNQARIINDDVFVINFIRLIIATIFIAFIGIFQRDFFLGFKKEGRVNLKYYLYIGIAGTLTLGLADTFFYKAAEINGLVFTSTITANTPMVQQIFSIIFLKEKFRKRFIIAVMLIIVGNYIILFL